MRSTLGSSSCDSWTRGVEPFNGATHSSESGLGTRDLWSVYQPRSEGGDESTETLAVEKRGVLERFAVGTLVFEVACGLKL